MQKVSFPFAYMILPWFLLLHATFSSTFPSPPRPRCHEDEKSALLEFKATYFTKVPSLFYCLDQSVKLESWKAESGDQPDVDCCAWDGVECDEVSGHVIALDLSCGFLSGPLDSNTSIFRLHHLQSLNLAFNRFNSSHIPLELGNLGFMTNLNLSHNNFEGQVPPSLSNLTQLTHLDLSWNLLSGPIPSQFQNLTQLTHLDMGKNWLNGTIPYYLGNFSKMKYLDIWVNKLGGEIPPSLRHLALLEHLNLGFNQFLTSEIPSFFKKSDPTYIFRSM